MYHHALTNFIRSVNTTSENILRNIENKATNKILCFSVRENIKYNLYTLLTHVTGSSF